MKSAKSGIIRKGDYEVVFSTHALFRAEERGVSWNEIEAVVQNGVFKRFGKRLVKISKKFREKTVVCVAEECGCELKVITITVNEKTTG